MTHYEREALEVILGDHRQTRRPVAEAMIDIGCNVRALAEKTAVRRALDRLRYKGLVGAAAGGWVPTPKALAPGGVDMVEEGPPTPREIGADMAEAPDTTAYALVQPSPVTPELINRCATMHLVLLEQARLAYEQGQEGASQELAWLIETGNQLVAAGGAR